MPYQGKEKDAVIMINRRYRRMLDALGKYDKRKARQQMEHMIERDYGALPVEFQDSALDQDDGDEE